MAIQTTRWSPDTCGCIIEYSWDDSVPQNSRTHSLANYVRRCSVHAVQADDGTRYNTINEENPRKNIAHQLIVDNAPAAFVDVDANGNKSLKPEYSISFTATGTPPNRVFTLTFSGATLTQAQINNVQTRLDNRFGTGKVIFVNA